MFNSARLLKSQNTTKILGEYQSERSSLYSINVPNVLGLVLLSSYGQCYFNAKGWLALASS